MSSLSIAIVGLPNVGKSTLFNALTDSHALAANYPFATIEPNTGVVAVPDRRLFTLAEIYNTRNVVPATVTFVDVAGLVAGASKGEGLGNQFLSHIRQCQAVVQVVRAFDDPNVTHVTGVADPAQDIAVINTELILADLQTVTKRLPKMEKESRVDPKLKPEYEALQAVHRVLDEGRPIWSERTIDPEQIRDLSLLTAKPVIYVFNLDEAGMTDDQKKQQLSQLAAPSQALFLCAKLEDELRTLEAYDRDELLSSYGQSEPGLYQLIRSAYASLGLQSYMTAGEKEVRAWTIKRGSTAPEAAGAIHTDLQRGFISAQVVEYDDLVAAGSFAGAKSLGKVRTEGKQYIMQPGDVVEFNFNVSKQPGR